MALIFVSYRRADSEETVGRLYDHLQRRFGAREVFKDADSIPFGVDFRQAIAEAVQNCRILVAVIGPRWLDARDEIGQRRLDKPEDFVRLEIEAALRAGLHVIPILIGGAKMPQASLLPPGMADLSYRNAVLLRPDPDFLRDVTRLIRAIARSTYKVRLRNWIAPANRKLTGQSAMKDVATVLRWYAQRSSTSDEIGEQLLALVRNTPAKAESLLAVLDSSIQKGEIPLEIGTEWRARVLATAAETKMRVPDSQQGTEADVGSDPESAVMLRPGTCLLNKFQLEKRLGGGGMGDVYQCLDLEALRFSDPNPRVALKVLSTSIQDLPNARLALQRESSRARQLAHANIIRVYEFYEDQGVCFITMELLQGRSWDAIMVEHDRGMPLPQAWPLIKQLCAALSYAHAEGVVHSDLKPQNLFLTEKSTVKVLDFGIAAPMRRAASDSRETLYNPRHLGALSPAYASLEMWSGADADARDDIYALACVVYKLLSGSHPFNEAPALEAFQQQLKPKPLKTLTKKQNRALQHALELSRTRRTPTVEDFAREFEVDAQPRVAKPLWLRGSLVASGLLVIAAAVLFRLLPSSTSSPSTAKPAEQRKIAGTSALKLAKRLGLTTMPFQETDSYSEAKVLDALIRTPRRVGLGSSEGEIEAAVGLCRESAGHCERDLYSDELDRQVVLQPFALDFAPVTVGAFRRFVDATHYTTEAERAGGAYALVDGHLRWLPRANWTNAVGTGPARSDAAVVGVTFGDAQQFCRWQEARLPTEDEWEYAARGPERHIFPWGDDPTPAAVHLKAQPDAADGPGEGIGGAYRGLSGNVWQWVDTPGQGGPDRQTLKGGSWLEENAANRRAATRRSEVLTRADQDTGFRCARSVAWPDADFWLHSLP